MFVGDSGTSQYTVTVTKDTGTNGAVITGLVCVTNGGAVTTQDLNIIIGLERNPGGGFITVPSSAYVYETNLSTRPQLLPGQSYCYTYRITITDPSQAIPGNNYRVTANVTITNHSGHLGETFGPSPRATTILPFQQVLIHNSISVTDDFSPTRTGITESSSWSYTRTFTCTEVGTDTEENTATIIYEDDNTTGNSATAVVTVNCYGLTVSKTAVPSHIRTYNWTIIKDVSGTEGSGYIDEITLNTKVGESVEAFYRIRLIPDYEDSLSVSGTITITNNAPIAAQLTNITDVITGNITADLDCDDIPGTLLSGETIRCHYTAVLPDMTSRTNTAVATLQNFSYAPNGTATPAGTTNFTGTAPIAFDNTAIQEVDETVNVSDDLYGALGSATASDTGTQTIFYSREIGPYTVCGTNPIARVVNTGTFTAVDTGATGSDTAAVNVNVSCQGCTHTIGFWKTHAGFTGNNDDLVTPLLTIWLGTPNTGKSVQVTTALQAVNLLDRSNDSSNGINRLYAQLLAAKLNIKSGADDSAVKDVIAAADDLLAQYNAADWGSLSADLQSQISNLATILDNYNNGIIGPGHCSESDETPVETPDVSIPIDVNVPENTNGMTININISNSSNLRVILGRCQDS